MNLMSSRLAFIMPPAWAEADVMSGCPQKKDEKSKASIEAGRQASDAQFEKTASQVYHMAQARKSVRRERENTWHNRDSVLN